MRRRIDDVICCNVRNVSTRRDCNETGNNKADQAQSYSSLNSLVFIALRSLFFIFSSSFFVLRSANLPSHKERLLGAMIKRDILLSAPVIVGWKTSKSNLAAFMKSSLMLVLLLVLLVCCPHSCSREMHRHCSHPFLARQVAAQRHLKRSRSRTVCQ